MSFFTSFIACARNIWGAATPKKNRPCQHTPNGVKNVLKRAICLNCNPECGVAFTRVRWAALFFARGESLEEEGEACQVHQNKKWRSDCQFFGGIQMAGGFFWWDWTWAGPPIVVFLQRTLKDKLPIFLWNTLLLYIPLLARMDRQNDWRRNEYTCYTWAGETFFQLCCCVSFWFWREIGFGFTYLCT